MNTFDESQLQPFLPYQLQFFCDQIVTQEELYHEIQTTRDIMINLEKFMYNGKRVLAKDKKMLMVKFTQLFRALLMLKANWRDPNDLYA